MSARSKHLIDDAILEAGSADYLDLWFITQIVEDVLGSADPDEVRNVALEAIERLLRSRKLRVGRLYPPGEFVASDEDTDHALERITSELRELGRKPQVGEIAWFEVPERGARD